MLIKFAKIGRSGQLRLPKSVREEVCLQPGDRVAIFRSGGKLILYPLTQTLLDLRGSVRVSGPQDFPAIRKKFVPRSAERPSLRDNAERRHEQDVTDPPDID